MSRTIPDALLKLLETNANRPETTTPSDNPQVAYQEGLNDGVTLLSSYILNTTKDESDGK